MNERLERLIIHSGLSSTEFGERIGATKQQVSNWKKDVGIPVKFINAILELLPDVNARWFLSGEGSMTGESCHKCDEKDKEIKTLKKENERLKNEVEKKEHALDVLDERRMDYLTILNELRDLKSELITGTPRTKKKEVS